MCQMELRTLSNLCNDQAGVQNPRLSMRKDPDVQRGECFAQHHPARGSSKLAGFNSHALNTLLFPLNTVGLRIFQLVLKKYPDEKIAMLWKTARIRDRYANIFPACTGKGISCSLRLPRSSGSVASAEKPSELLAFCIPEAALIRKQLLLGPKTSSLVGTKPPECQSYLDLLQLC